MGRVKSGIELYEIVSSVAAPKTGKGERRRGKHRVGLREGKRLSEKSETEIQTDTGNEPVEGLFKLAGFEGRGRAARLMLLLGIDEAARVMAKLKPDEAEEVAQEIASIRHMDSVEAQRLLDDFREDFADVKARRVRGGVDTAREILITAFGKENAERIILKSLPDAAPKRFAFLNDLSFSQLTNLLRKESPTTLAFVLTYLEPAKASSFLGALPKAKLLQVVLKIARTREVSMELVNTVESALQEKLRHIGKDESDELDGRFVLADILRHMDISDERRLLDSLESTDVALADQVKEKLYTMDSVIHMRDRDLQDVLAEMKEQEIALLLKGQAREIKNRIKLSLSKRRLLMVEDESDIMGGVKRSEADAAVRNFLERLRSGEEEGIFSIIREESDLIE